jgi:RNA polymerase sigma factor (sigma-70 family)
LAHGLGVAGREVDPVSLVELLPRQRPLPALRTRLLADHGDRPLADPVQITEAASLRLVVGRRVHADAGGLEPDPGLDAELVAPEEAVERRLTGKPRQLDGGDTATAGRFLPGLLRTDDLAGARHRLDPDELDPLDMPDDRQLHKRTLTDAGRSALQGMMQAVTPVPPFERFYVEHRDIVLGFLRRRMGGQTAEDAFQETFLRALRAYDRLEHGEHLRAWVLTIAARLAIDTSRRARPTAHELPELPVEDGRPAYAQIEHLADSLPPTERAALVLRYAYDLSYDDIAVALSSTPEAARQAASSGVRRLRALAPGRDLREQIPNTRKPGRIHDRLA